MLMPSMVIRDTILNHSNILIVVASAINNSGSSGQEAVSLSVAEKYIEAWSGIAKEGNTVVVPANVSDVSGMVAQVEFFAILF